MALIDTLVEGSAAIPWALWLGLALGLFVAVTGYDLFRLLRPKSLERVDMDWQTASAEEVSRNLTTLASFGVALLFVEFIVYRLSPLPRWWMAVLALGFAPIFALLVLGRNYAVGPRGIILDGHFHSWNKFTGFVLQHRLARVQLVRRHFAIWAPLFVTHSDLGKLSERLEHYLERYPTVGAALRDRGKGKGIMEE